MNSLFDNFMIKGKLRKTTKYDDDGDGGAIYKSYLRRFSTSDTEETTSSLS